ncbi:MULTISPECIES: type II secretion system major pseudopilin GspG [Hyphomonas]|uniref:Type II secretion system core protein G n=1 Tax=Hyphomonas jannaschiana VP2 TaxID=1280952 RepID=A0A059F989_9PROT|nr:type II secretion system major pseudopilin GspG [Hyphomonas jannaschiana]KCZ87184.1 general secretion pathway protein G [Hyphomonas jannaschiana VP2]MCA8890338.1 type II secretion system major pseudopilin GspG [Hyphomonas sp.]
MVSDETNKDAQPRKDSGFSLVELMVVIFIMGLLATLVIINVAPVGEQSRVGKVRADIAAFESALEMYSLDMYAYPSADAGLAALKTPPAGADVATYRPGGYIKRLRDDPWGNPYHYDVPGQRSGGGYDVYSSGPDGKPGTADDIGNWE